MADGILNPIEQLEADFDFDVYTKQEVDALLDEKADKSDTYTKTETDALLNDKADADAVYTKTETDNLLDGKADKSTTLAGYGITDAYTKTQTDNLLNGKADADSVYTKSEIDTKIPSSVGSATKPVYVNGGVVSACTYELNKTVPANAVFTDTTYTAGNGLNLNGTSFSAKAGENVTVDSSGINVNGNGVVASADSGLVSGGTAYTELRPTLDGTWVKNAQTTAINLQKLEGGIEYLYGLLSHQYDQLKKYINGNYYDYDTDANSKYVKAVPNGAMPYASLEQIGGKTLVWNQLLTPNIGTTAGVQTTQSADGTVTCVGTNTSSGWNSFAIVPVTTHKYVFLCSDYQKLDESSVVPSLLRNYSEVGKVIERNEYYFDNTAGSYSYLRVVIAGNGYVNFSAKYNVFDLTLLFGAGNEPTTVAEFTAQFPASYYPYNAGTLLSAGVTSVISKKADTTELATYSIPAEVQALTGYGWSVQVYINNVYSGDVYNQIDFENKKYIQNVGKVTLNGSESWTWDTGNALAYTIIPNGFIVNNVTQHNTYVMSSNPTITSTSWGRRSMYTYTMGMYYGQTRLYCKSENFASANDVKTYFTNNPTDVNYVLQTPVETDISAYLTDDNLIEVEAGGTLTFPNSNGDDYRIDVPSSETYMVDLQSALGE